MRGFARVAAVVTPCTVADVDANVEATLAGWQRAHEERCAVVVFPELGLVGYTARDLFHDRHVLDRVVAGVASLAERGKKLSPLAIVGAPLRDGDALYNVAIAIQHGRVLAVVPKAYLPNYREFEEHRWFRPGRGLPAGSTIELFGELLPFGPDILLSAAGCPDLVVGIEICEDIWVH